jgi:hypothetical protein
MCRCRSSQESSARAGPSDGATCEEALGRLELASSSSGGYAPLGGRAPGRVESLWPAVRGPWGGFPARHVGVLGGAPSGVPLRGGRRIRRFGKGLPARPKAVDRLKMGLLAVLKHPQPADGYRGRQHQDDQVNHDALLTSLFRRALTHFRVQAPASRRLDFSRERRLERSRPYQTGLLPPAPLRPATRFVDRDFSWGAPAFTVACEFV